MIAALYIRVSTEEQAQEGFSIAAQVKALQEYCAKNNIEIYKIYADEGVSGQKEDRPQFQQMIRDAEKKFFNIILVHKYDRFARKVELSQKVKNQLKKTNVNVISITEPIEDSPMGFFVSGLHDLLAEYYVRNLAQETKKGHVERASQGLHNGSVPFGYKIDKLTGNMVINEEQAKVVRWIFEMYNHKGYGSTKIAMILNNHGIRTAVNGKWAHYTVNRILKNVKYAGNILYDGQIYDGKHEAIICEDEYNLANKNMTDRTSKWDGYRGMNYDKYLLLGITKCGECNHAFSVHKAASGKRKLSCYYYRCNDALRYCDGCKHTKCYPIHKLEEYILNYIKDVANGVISDFQVSKKVNVHSILEDRKLKIENELLRAKKAYLASVFTLEEYGEIKNNLEAELLEIENTKVSNDDIENNKNILRVKIQSIWDEFENAAIISEKREKLSRFIDCIYIYKDKITVNFYI